MAIKIQAIGIAGVTYDDKDENQGQQQLVVSSMLCRQGQLPYNVTTR